MYRATADIDILADIRSEHVHQLFELLQDRFYLDEQTMRDAVSQGRSFNVIHFDSVFKVDFFVARSDEFAHTQLDRGDLRKISPENSAAVYVATAEDTILAKLRWYRVGQETSNTQWNDVIGILGIAHDNLDFDYLRSWSNKLGVADLLQRAIDEGRED